MKLLFPGANKYENLIQLSRPSVPNSISNRYFNLQYEFIELFLYKFDYKIPFHVTRKGIAQE